MRSDVTKDAVGRWPSILMALGVHESFLRNRHGPCPVCGGVDRWRFDDKEKGLYFCSNCGPGDGFRLVEKFFGCDFKTAAEKVRAVLPSSTVAPSEKKADDSRRRERMNRIWAQAKSLQDGDAVCRYLEGRGIPLIGAPDDLRCAEAVDYFDAGKKLGTYQAMVAMIRGPDGAPRSLHVTYLKDGKKADVPSPKKILGPIGRGAAIRLSPATDRLCVCEGIETALAIMAHTDWPVWAAISANGLINFEIPDNILTLRIAADNDTNFVGQSAACELARRVHDRVQVEVVMPDMRGTDFADPGAMGSEVWK